VICTHPGENATCVQEGAAAVQQGNQTTPVKLTCEQCFTKFLSSAQLELLCIRLPSECPLQLLCSRLPFILTEAGLVDFLVRLGLSESAALQLVQCLKDAGTVFPTDTDSVRTLR
jgi:hypothetical protein